MKRFYRFHFLFIGFCLIFLLTSNTSAVKADIAPPEQPPGSNVVPEEENTQVQMVSETVIFDIQNAPYNRKGNEAHANLVDDWAKVTATFYMKNQGNETEKMEVRFPLTQPYGMGDGFFNYPEIENVFVTIDGEQASTSKVTTRVPELGGEYHIEWAAFGASFPPSQEVIIEVKYDVQATGYSPLSTFNYIFETGHGWKDEIGTADLIIRLPYEANEENFVSGEYYQTTGGFTIQGNEIHWSFFNMEPTRADNLYATLVQGSVWREVLAANDDLETKSEIGDAWGRLARAYKLAILENKGWLRSDHGGILLLEKSIKAYENALSFSPNTARWHAGFAELMWAYTLWDNPKDPDILLRVAEECHRALELDPNNQQALEVLESLQYYEPESVSKDVNGFIYHILTATVIPDTPTAVIIPLLSDTPIPTPGQTVTPITAENTSTPTVITGTPAATPTTVSEQSSEKGFHLPFCGSPLAIVLTALVVRQKKIILK